MGTLQGTLFPSFEKCYETRLTEQEQHLIKVLGLVKVERFVFRKAVNQWRGRKLKEREAIARAFVARKVHKHKYTSLLIDELKRSPNLKRICGFDDTSEMPCESTFSRAFAEFAESGLGDRVHDALVEAHLKKELIGHISRDSTAIEGREKPVKKTKKEKKEKAAKKKGRPKKGEMREKPKKRNGWIDSSSSQWERLLKRYRRYAMSAARKTPKGIKKAQTPC